MDNSRFVQEVIEKTDIVELVSEFVKLEKAGNNYRGLCPFHNEKTPSFMVSPTKKIAKCMGCGAGGNPISFLMKIKNISYNEALKELADRAGLKNNITIATKKVDKNQKYYNITDVATKFYIHNLHSTKQGLEALKYLHERNLDDDTIKRFNIGLAPVKRDTLYNVLKENNFLDLDIVECGLIKSSEDGYYDVFKNRIMFPITDEYGHFIGYSGRIYEQNQINEFEPKYINSTENVIFSKSNVLYNLSNAISSIRRKKRVLLYEGFMNVIASTKADLDEAVCSMGTSLTINQARLLKKYTNNVIICYDGDLAGVTATDKAIDILSSVGLNVMVCNLVEGMDADVYVATYGSEAYNEYVSKNTVDPYQFRYAKAFKNRNINNPLELESIKQDIFKFLKNASNLVVESIFNRLSVDINVSKQAIISDFNRYNTISTIKKNDEKQSEVIKLIQNQNKVIAAELLILKIASISSANYNKVVDSMIEYRFLNEDSRTLMNAFGIYYRKYNSFNELSFLDTTSEDAKKIYFRYQENIHFKYSLGDVLELPKLIKIFDEYEAKQKMLQLLKEACESSNKDEISAKLEESRNLRKKMKL